MAGEIPLSSPAGASGAQMQQLENALNQIGVTRSHKSIIFLVVCGVLFDVFEQNAVGLVGPLLREQWGLSATDIGFLNTITFIAAAMGRLLSGYMADRFGRRTMLNVNLALFTFGAIGCALAPGYTMLAIARFVVGFGLGGEITTAVTMLAEFCSAKFRGTAVGLINVGGGGLGNMLAPAFALGVFALFPGENAWRWLFGCLVLPALFIVFYRRFIPETPRYLLSKGRVDEANRVLSMLASGKLANAEFPLHAYITASADDQAPAAAARNSFADIFRGGYARRTIAVGIASWMTFGAQLSVLTLMPTILVAQGYSITKSFTFTIIMQSGSLLGALAASTMGYYFPRKRVLTVGAVAACLAGLAFGNFTSSVAVVLLCGALFQFCVLTLNTSIWIYAPELYPTRIRGLGTSFLLALGTIGGAMSQVLAGKMFDLYGVAGMFGMIAAMYVLFAIAVQFAPETFGRSIEEEQA
ncbi:MFS transporter [Acidovorax sp. CCYZU-2555]|uniref:MFS transporter n=1 Tax=Acidovorax sp. CCYZU-2555 TaxID=2835042 RepID=UPI001BCAAECD|nr:MFS transporter [Acidovorax sp. CCYZU-2555]MBS7777820.1 MFS transporter [Acidovorax sp. CCYZU-2555]